MHAPGKADLNPYAYVHGAILKSIDPLGLEPDDNESSSVGSSHSNSSSSPETKAAPPAAPEPLDHDVSESDGPNVNSEGGPQAGFFRAMRAHVLHTWMRPEQLTRVFFVRARGGTPSNWLAQGEFSRKWRARDRRGDGHERPSDMVFNQGGSRTALKRQWLSSELKLRSLGFVSLCRRLAKARVSTGTLRARRRRSTSTRSSARDAQGNTEVFKYGISSGKVTKAGQSYRAETQVHTLNKAAQGQYSYESSIVEHIPGGNGAREEALETERSLVYKYNDLTGAKPPGNIRP